MARPVLYQLCGLPFSGKSTLAKKLQKRLDVHISSLDAMIESYNFYVPEMSQDQWGEVYQALRQDITDTLQQGESVIADSAALHKAERDVARRIAEESHADYVLIYMKVPLDEIQERRERNKITKERGGMDDKHFQLAQSKFEQPAENEKHVIYVGEVDVEAWIDDNILLWQSKD